MTEFFVTEIDAKNRHGELEGAAESLGLSTTISDTVDYEPGGRDEFERYMLDNDITFFSIDEAVKPHHPDKAEKAGFDDLTPPIHLWPWSLLVLKLGDMMREAVGSSIRMRNLYRPMSYNKLVAKSGLKSDHPNACSGDFDFKSTDDRRVAENLIRGLSRDHPNLELSLGMGKRTLHVGVMSPKGHRSWFYDNYPDSKTKLE